MKHSTKMMWGCVALLVVAAALSIAGASIGYFFLLPCLLMMGVMFWMMMGGMSGGSRGKDE